MAIPIHLQQFKAAGIYRVVFDKSTIVNQDTELLRLVVGYSEQGPFNTPVYVKDPQTFVALFGNINKKLEKRGIFFHRLAIQMLQVSPCLVLNLKKFSDETVDGLTISSDFITPEIDTEPIDTVQLNVTDIYDTTRFWTLDADKLINLRSVDGRVMDQYINIATTNTKKTSATIFIRKANGSKVSGYNITVNDWYSDEQGGVPEFLEHHKNSLISDFFAEVYVFNGKFTAKQVLASDTLKNYFVVEKNENDDEDYTLKLRDKVYNAFGDPVDTLDVMFADSTSNPLGHYVGALIPEFKNKNNAYMSLDIAFNTDIDVHNMMMSFNTDLLYESAEGAANIDLSGKLALSADEDDEVLDKLFNGEYSTTVLGNSHAPVVTDKIQIGVNVAKVENNVVVPIVEFKPQSKSVNGTLYTSDVNFEDKTITLKQVGTGEEVVFDYTNYPIKPKYPKDATEEEKEQIREEALKVYMLDVAEKKLKVKFSETTIAVLTDEDKEYNATLPEAVHEGTAKPDVPSTSYEIINDENSFNESLANGVLAKYYAKYPNEDRWNVVENRACSFNDKVYTTTVTSEGETTTVKFKALWYSDTVQKLTNKVDETEVYYTNMFYDIDETEYILYTDDTLTTSANKTAKFTAMWDDETCPHCYAGAINAPESSLANSAWICPNFGEDKEMPKLKYGVDTYTPWEGAISWGIASAKADLGVETFDANNFSMFTVPAPYTKEEADEYNSTLEGAHISGTKIEYAPINAMGSYYKGDAFSVIGDNRLLLGPEKVITSCTNIEPTALDNYYTDADSNLHVALMDVQYITKSVSTVSDSDGNDDSVYGSSISFIDYDEGYWHFDHTDVKPGSLQPAFINDEEYADRSLLTILQVGDMLLTDDGIVDVDGNEEYDDEDEKFDIVYVQELGTKYYKADDDEVVSGVKAVGDFKYHYVLLTGELTLGQDEHGYRDKDDNCYLVRIDSSLNQEIGTMKPYYLEGYTYKSNRPDGTGMYAKLQWQKNILSALTEYKGLRRGLLNKSEIDYRYVIDTFQSFPDASVKKELTYLAKEKQSAFCIANFPSAQTFVKCPYTSFTDSNGVFNVEYVVKGSNKKKASSLIFSLPDDTEGASFAAFYTPLKFTDGYLDSIIPSAGLVSNLFIEKYRSRQPYYIVAGPNYGRITASGLVGPDYKYTMDELQVIEPFGVNCMVYRPSFGTFINANQTAKQTPLSALSKVHVRELVIYLQDEIEKVLQAYQWEFNNSRTREAILSRANDICSRVMSNGGLQAYRNVMDESNNTPEIIDNEMAVLSTHIEPGMGCGKMVHELTLYRSGQMASSISES